MSENMKDMNGLGLGLSLSLGLKTNESEPCLQLNLMEKPSHPMQNHPHRTSWNESFQFPDRNPDTRSFLIDVNEAPSMADFEEENGVSSPNSTVSSLSGKRSDREPIVDENEGERTSCSHGGGSDDEDGNGGDMSRKKLRLSKEQSLLLEETFKEHNTLNPKQKQELAKQLNLRSRQVEVWFQNRRARTKLKQTEVDCELLKRCCEKLTEDNRRLHKEVQELRALKLSPQFYMQMNPPTTLTMCPSCERVAVSSSSSSAAAPASSPALANGPTCQNGPPNIQRPIPISPWAKLPIQHRTRDASAPR
ncbi:homeobox-leucine zipper protein HAT3 [Pyrus ussuriensis x Pyrus communis]|uniref:Homeobox-leucine zipper protein HAT3 n=1 Tax=Pyrus ussuriensis x Pyrus communis TaxID=2448454 RepID=A0A5N5HTY0_9ROSA|nr:homeobox-leucine zipper protein HAT3 [Pyrus ussuriensis x Pyrus communis]